MAFDFHAAANKVRLLAQELAAQDVNPVGRMPHEASQLLTLAWMDCVNLEAEAKMAGQSEVMSAAKKLARQSHSSDECTAVSLSGPAMVVKVNGREYPAPAYNMGGAQPLWALFVQEAKRDSGQN